MHEAFYGSAGPLTNQYKLCVFEQMLYIFNDRLAGTRDA